ncbi:hypothetical protein D3C78_1161440 [compost metagenome]
MPDGRPRLEPFRAERNAVVDRAATEHAERVVQGRQSFFGGRVAGIDKKAVGVQQARGTDEPFRVPPPGWALRRAARAQDAFVQPIQLFPVLRRLQPLDGRWRLVVDEIGPYPLVLPVEHAHVDDQVPYHGQAGQRPYDDVHIAPKRPDRLSGRQFPAVEQGRDAGDAGQAVGAVDVHAVGAADALATTAPVGQRLVLGFQVLQQVEHHHVLARLQVVAVVLHARRVIFVR